MSLHGRLVMAGGFPPSGTLRSGNAGGHGRSRELALPRAKHGETQRDGATGRVPGGLLGLSRFRPAFKRQRTHTVDQAPKLGIDREPLAGDSLEGLGELANRVCQ